MEQLLLFKFTQSGQALAVAAISHESVPKLLHYLQEVLLGIWQQHAFGVRLLIRSDFAASWEKW